MSRKGSILRKKNLASPEGPVSPWAGPLSDEQLQPSQVTHYDHDNKGCCKHDKSTQTEPVQIFPAEVIVQVVQELQPGMGVCPKCAGRRDGRDHNYTMDMTGLSIVRYKVKRCQCTRSPGSNPVSKNLCAVNEEDGAEIECASADKEESAETENASADKEDTENKYTSVCKTEDAETDNACDNHIQQQEEGLATSAGDTSCSSTGFHGHETVSVSYSDLELPIKMECEDVTFDYPGGNTGQTHTVLTVKEEATDELLNEINMATSWPGSTSEHVRGRKVCCAESDNYEVYPTKKRKCVKDSPSTSGSHQMPDYLHDAQYVVSFGDGKTSFLESEDEYGGSGKAPVGPGESSHQLELRAAEGGRPISQEGRTGVEPSGQQVPETSRIKVRGEAKPSQCEESAAEDHKQGARGERKSGRRTSTKHLHADTVYERWGVLENSTDAESRCNTSTEEAAVHSLASSNDGDAMVTEPAQLQENELIRQSSSTEEVAAHFLSSSNEGDAVVAELKQLPWIQDNELPSASDSGEALSKSADVDESNRVEPSFDKDNVNTKKATRVAVSILREYLGEKQKAFDFEHYDKQELNLTLGNFFLEIRNRNGEFYRKNTLKSIRAGLARHLQRVAEIDIMNDPDFAEANKKYQAQIAYLKKAGKSDTDTLSGKSANVGEPNREKLIDSVNTKKATRVAVSVLREYLGEKRKALDFEHYDKQELNLTLGNFFVEVRNKNGEFYHKNTLKSIRAGLARHLQHVAKVDIMKDLDFAEANKKYQAQIAYLKKTGKAEVDHHPTLTDEDLARLNQYFATVYNTPRGLQQKVFFDLLLHVCHRGRENLHKLKKSDIAVAKDTSGAKYIHQTQGKLTKNHPGDNPGDSAHGGRLYECKGSPLCPVVLFEQYLKKLHPKNEFFFQRPKQWDSSSSSVTWYDNSKLGKNTLGKMMRDISQCAELSQRYTNHSLRSTSVTLLDSQNFDARHIMAVSMHKSKSSIRRHATKVKDSKRRKMSEALHFACGLMASAQTTDCQPNQQLDCQPNQQPDQELVE